MSRQARLGTPMVGATITSRHLSFPLFVFFFMFDFQKCLPHQFNSSSGLYEIGCNFRKCAVCSSCSVLMSLLLALVSIEASGLINDVLNVKCQVPSPSVSLSSFDLCSPFPSCLSCFSLSHLMSRLTLIIYISFMFLHFLCSQPANPLLTLKTAHNVKSKCLSKHHQKKIHNNLNIYRYKYRYKVENVYQQCSYASFLFIL